ncbi:MAG: DUF177 domain-containing protein [Thermodesulfobacteriota bacterium]|nr:DUF177 domain-containing protein [Thermodesulfobacteriota bacterium]
MQLQVGEIKKGGVDLQIEEAAAHFPVLAELERNRSCIFMSPVVVSVRAYEVSGMIELVGHIAVEVSVPCKRCLAPSQFKVDADFAQTYVDELPEVSGEDGEELELSAEEMGLEQFEGDSIDLTEEIQQQVVLLLPDHSLCSETCKGLCLTCGTDLNKACCDCSELPVSLSFAALRDFKVEK